MTGLNLTVENSTALERVLSTELETLKAKVRRYKYLLEKHSSFPSASDGFLQAEEYTELCNLDYDLRELCK